MFSEELAHHVQNEFNDSFRDTKGPLLMNIVGEYELFTPVYQDFNNSRQSGCDDPHQNLIVIHTPGYLVNKKRHVKRASVFVAD
jgi:hypothetical protein